MILEVAALLVAVFAIVLGMTASARDTFGPVMLFTLMAIPSFLVRPLLILFIPGAEGQLGDFVEDPKPAAAWAILLFALSMVAFLAGYFLWPRYAGHMAASIPAPRQDVDSRRLARVTVVVVGASTISLLVFLVQAGSWSRLVDAARHGLFAGLAPLASLPVLAMVLSVLVLLHAQRAGRGLRFPLLLLATSSLISLSYGDRDGLYLPVIIYLIGYHYSIRKITLPRFAVVAVAVIAGMAVLGLMRGAIFTGGDFGDTLMQVVGPSEEGGSAESLIHSLNAERFDRLAIVMHDFDHSELRGGKDFWLGFVTLIPRLLWEDKPDLLRPGAWFTQTYTPWKEGGQPFTAQGDWYLNFGVPGVAIGFLASGFLFRVVRAYQERLGFVPWVNVLYAVMFFRITSWGALHSGTVIQATLYLVPFALVIWLTTGSPEHPRIWPRVRSRPEEAEAA